MGTQQKCQVYISHQQNPGVREGEALAPPVPFQSLCSLPLHCPYHTGPKACRTNCSWSASSCPWLSPWTERTVFPGIWIDQLWVTLMGQVRDNSLMPWKHCPCLQCWSHLPGPSMLHERGAGVWQNKGEFPGALQVELRPRRSSGSQPVVSPAWVVNFLSSVNSSDSESSQSRSLKV